MKTSFPAIFKRIGFAAVCALLLSATQCVPGGGGPTEPDAGLYHTFAETEAALRQLAQDHPEIAQLASIGKSVEGRDLWAIKISDNVATDEAEPVIVFTGAHHAREWISVETPLMLSDHLVKNYDSDANVAALVDGAEIWIAPMVNPDGHVYSVSTNRLWRKNRRDNGDGTFGVDLNRNYGHNWGGPGASRDTFSDIYRGPSAFSEPETQAMRDFLDREQPAALVSYHNFSQLVLYPWGTTSDPAPDEALLQNLATAMADRIKAVHGQNYTPQQSSQLYLASGDTTDWLYALLGVPAFTIELRPRGSFPGFELPEDQIQPTFEENLPAALYLIGWAIGQTTTL